MKTAGALPWIASALMHAGLLLLPVGILLRPGTAPRPPLSIDVTLAAARPPRTQGPPAQARLPTTPLTTVPTTAPDAARGPAFRTVPEVTGVSSTLAPDDLSPDGSRAPGASGTSELASLPAAEQALIAAATSGTGSAIGWTGTPRALIRRRDPRFPPVLSLSGQEVEGEARITVAPSGAVVRVEITRSTGYIEIDASVEAALRDYLFSRVDGRGDALGTVRFRFRLEKTD